MKVASYISTKAGYKGIGDFLIRVRLSGLAEALHLYPYGGSKLRATHSELVFEPGDGVDHLMPDGTCEPDEDGALWCVSSTGLDRLPSWSSRRAGKLGGVRFKRIVVDNPKKWSLCNIYNSDPLSAALIAKEYEGALYDWQNISSFIAPFIPEKGDRYMCSEFVAKCLLIPNSSEYDPCELQAYCQSLVQPDSKTIMLALKQFFSGVSNAD